MAQKANVKKGDTLIIRSQTTGYMRAWAEEDKSNSPGDSALLKVMVNSAALPGVTEMEINTNTWDVWLGDDVTVLKKIAEEVLVPDRIR